MKKICIGFVGIITLIMLFAACGGTPKTATASGVDELDAKIREASDYLNTRIPNGNKVAFINISGGYPDLADYILGDLSRHGVNDGKFSVVDRALLDQVREELNFNLSGEVDDNYAQEIGKMLGAQTIVSGSVRKVGNLFRLEVKAIEVQTAAVQGQQIWNIANGATITSLTANTGSGTATATAGGARTTASGGTAQAAASARPANGTYTFFPRPRAYQGAAPANLYLEKIIVRGEFMNIYTTGSAQGPFQDPGYGTQQSYTNPKDILLQDLDRPSRAWNPEGGGIGSGFDWEPGSNYTVIWHPFKGVTAQRFSITFTTANVPVILEEIDLSKAEYEP